MKYTIEKIASIVNGELLSFHQNDNIEYLLFDSRKINAPATSLFFALKGPRRDGHLFISELYSLGIKNFIISEKINTSAYPQCNFIMVDDTLMSFQELAAYHRRQFDFPVIGITGSNGKTIVKEWLYQLLHEDHNIVRNPKSYNSQIGVPLSVWQMNEQHTLGIFEAGISQPGEMEKLETIIQPTIGILTNIGQPHSEGFNSFTEKALEKIKLFRHCQKIIYPKDNAAQLDLETEDKKFFRADVVFYSWSNFSNAWLKITAIEKKIDHTIIKAQHKGKEIAIQIPFTDDASVENAITCWCTLLAMDLSNEVIAMRMQRLAPVNMRLELKKGINHCIVINDSYSADMSSLEIALDFLDQQSGAAKKTIIISDFLQAGLSDEALYYRIAHLLEQHHIDRLIGIGDNISRQLAVMLQHSGIQQDYFLRTESFLQHFRASQFKEETILVKGARVFEFERIVRLLEQKVHETVLEINLNAIAHNLKEYQKLLKPSTKVMSMVKAFAYGSGGSEIAGILQYHKADYLGVAYADEGVELRRSGINIPIMVMNPEESSFDAIIENNLEPEIYSFELLQSFDTFLQKEALQQYPIHIEIETGMNRLGFAADEMEELAKFLLTTNSFRIQTVFSHLTASEDPQQDNFTMEQFNLFQQAAQQLQDRLGYPFLRHIANSAAIVRHPQLQLDIVRLGIGLYGVDNTKTKQLHLQTVATLRSTISQIKHLKANESVSYNRSGMLNKDSVIATVRIGYADGYPRRLGNGVGKMLINGKQVPVVGIVCMDMTMIDITNISGVHEGDEVIVFGKELTVQQIAQWAGTIPYEIMTGISQRVKRVYFEE